MAEMAGSVNSSATSNLVKLLLDIIPINLTGMKDWKIEKTIGYIKI